MRWVREKERKWIQVPFIGSTFEWMFQCISISSCDYVTRCDRIKYCTCLHRMSRFFDLTCLGIVSQLLLKCLPKNNKIVQHDCDNGNLSHEFLNKLCGAKPPKVIRNLHSQHAMRCTAPNMPRKHFTGKLFAQHSSRQCIAIQNEFVQIGDVTLNHTHTHTDTSSYCTRHTRMAGRRHTQVVRQIWFVCGDAPAAELINRFVATVILWLWPISQSLIALQLIRNAVEWNRGRPTIFPIPHRCRSHFSIFEIKKFLIDFFNRKKLSHSRTLQTAWHSPLRMRRNDYHNEMIVDGYRDELKETCPLNRFTWNYCISIDFTNSHNYLFAVRRSLIDVCQELFVRNDNRDRDVIPLAINENCLVDNWLVEMMNLLIAIVKHRPPCWGSIFERFRFDFDLIKGGDENDHQFTPIEIPSIPMIWCRFMATMTTRSSSTFLLLYRKTNAATANWDIFTPATNSNPA